MADRVVNTISRWRVDTASINAAVAANKRVEGSLAAVEAQESALAAQSRALASTPTGMEQIVAAAKRGEIGVDALRDTLRSLGQQDAEIKQVVDQLERVDQAARRAQDSAAQLRFDDVSRGVALAGDAQSNLGAIRGIADIAGLGGVGSGIGAVGEIIALGEELPRLKAAVQGLPEVFDKAASALGTNRSGLLGGLALGAIAIGAFAIAQQELEKQTKANTEAAKAYSSQLAGIAGQTETDIQQQITDQENLLAAYREGRQTLLDYQDQLETIGSDSAATGSDVAAQEAVQARFRETYAALSAATGGAINNAGELNAALQQSEEDIGIAERAFGFLTVALNSSAVAAQTAAQEAIDQANAEVAAVERRIGRNIEYNQLLASGSAEQVRGLIDADRIRKDVLLAFVGSIEAQGVVSEEAAAKAAAYRIEIEELIIHQDTLTKNILPLVEAMERANIAAEALSDSTDAYFEALEWEVDARQKMADITTEINRIETERVAKLTELAAELSKNQTELWRKAGEDVLAAEGKAQEAREKQQEQHWKRVQEINRRANATIANAVAARDVLAAYLATKQRDEDLRKEKEANEDRLKEIDSALEDQKDAIAKRLKEQLDVLQANYRKQVDATNDAARKATDIQRQAYREQEVALQNAIMAQRNISLAAQQIRSGDELSHQTLLTEIARNGAQYIETTWLNLWNAMIAGMPAGGGSQFPPIMPPGGPGGGGGPLPTPYTPGVAGGGLPSPAAAARSGAVINMPVTITASDEQAAVQQFVSAFREARRRLG